MRSPVIWYGGKGQIVQRILPLLPPHTTYVEPFAGGASCLFAKAPAPIECLNDIHDGLMAFYAVLRDPAQFAELDHLCALTPYSRSQWASCRAAWAGETEPVRKAWAFFMWVRQSIGAHETSGWSYTPGAPDSSSVTKYLSAIDRLPEAHARLRQVHVECGPWQRVLAAWDGAATLFYCDPPYALGARVGGKRYAHEFADGDHAALVDRLLTVGGMVVLSGYAGPLYEPLEAAGWERIDIDVPVSVAVAERQQRRTESLWRNPAAVAAWERARGPLFALAEGEGR